jgi:tetratricopeptide (TPR) repeat protein
MSSRMSATRQLRPAAQPGSARLGERVRQLRVAAGLTQTDLAGDRFSKEYVSQIERGKTRPTRETIEWLAGKLGVDAGFLERGVSADERSRVETMLARAEALTNAERFDESIEEYDNLQTALLATGAVDLEVRALTGRAWALVERGDVRDGLAVLEQARQLAERPEFSDIDRADLLYRMGYCRYKLSSNATALGLFNEALTLAEGSGLPCDALRAEIFHSRALCYRKQRDFEAAREDVERALELAEALDDRRTMADVFLNASLVAERMGQWVLARSYAERARGHYQELNDGRKFAGVLNNLGGLNLLLGRPEQAIEHLKASFGAALEVDSVETAAQAEGSLATVHLHLGDWEQAEELARHALSLLTDREDYLHEIAPTQLVLGRALMEQNKLEDAEQWLRASDSSAERLESIGHRAAAWIALGDLETRRNNQPEAAVLYRRAAEALQDVRF